MTEEISNMKNRYSTYHSNYCAINTQKANNVPQHSMLSIQSNLIIHKKLKKTETHSSCEHVKHECTQTPPVHCLAMSTSHQDLWSPVVWWFVFVRL